MAKQTTGKGLNADEAFKGLVDFGLFADKTPPCFNSVGLSVYVSTRMKRILTESDPSKLKRVLDKYVHSQLKYQVLRDINIPRQLSVPHPESYLAHCLAIKKIWSKVKSHCAQPSFQASRIYVQKSKDSRIFQMNYKGVDRFQIEESDISFQTGASHVVRADISKCFPSIYTHCIPWAIHGKKTAKIRRGDLSLEGNILDKACQILSDNQTNGIAIGPHSSNIISEIVLTKIDSQLIKKGFVRFSRHIDDYTFYARSAGESEAFLRELNLSLREYELALNEKKTSINSLPEPSSVRWINELSMFSLSSGVVRYTEVRSFLDLALVLAKSSGSSAVLNYAIKSVPTRLNERAKRLFTAEAVNLCLAYPYLAPLMEEHVFEKHRHGLTNQQVELLANELINIGIEKVHPDSIAFSLYYSLRYSLKLNLTEDELKKIIEIDDCLTNVLLWDYAKSKGLLKIVRWLTTRAGNLKSLSKSDQDLQWLLIYTIWDEATLRGNGQGFLADLKKDSFSFINY